MSEMLKEKSLLLACHCKTPFGKLHEDPILSTSEKKEFLSKSESEFKTISYLDISPECPEQKGQFKSWSSVASDSVDYIYILNCPIYEALLHGRIIGGETYKMFDDLILEGYRILKKSGKIVIPITEYKEIKKNPETKELKFIHIDPSLQLPTQLNNLLKTKRRFEDTPIVDLTKWLVYGVKKEIFEFSIDVPEVLDQKTDKIILQKQDQEGGRKKKPKNKSRKTKKKSVKRRYRY